MSLPPHWEQDPDATLDDLDDHCTTVMYHIVDTDGKLSWQSSVDYDANVLPVCYPPVYLKKRVKELCGRQFLKRKLCRGTHITHILLYQPTGEHVGIGFVQGMFKLWTPWQNPSEDIAARVLELCKALWEPEEGEEMYPAPRRSARLNSMK